MPSTTILSKVKADLTRDEGWRSRPYRDTAGHLTIGVGHNLDAEGLCNLAIAVQLDYDIQTKSIDPLDRHLPWWREHSEDVQRVLINLMFNMGPATLLTFKQTLGLIKGRKYKDAAEQLLKSRYARQVGERANRLAEVLRNAEGDPA